MDLSARYEKLGRVGGESVRVSWARDRAASKSVLLHEFQDDSQLLRVTAQYLLLNPSQSKLLACGEWEKSSCIVTTDDLDLMDLRSWLEFQIAKLQGDVSGASVSPGSGTFSQVFSLPTQGAANPPAATPASPPSELQSPPGEFTRIFSAPPKDAPSHNLSGILGGNSPVPPDAKPGEFTMIFQPQSFGSSNPPNLTPPPPEVKPPAGEFTRMFGPGELQLPMRDMPTAELNIAPPPPPPVIPVRDEPSISMPPSQMSWNSPHPTAPSEPPPNLSPTPVVSDPGAPSEYTRVIQRSSITLPSPPSSIEPPQPQAPPPEPAAPPVTYTLPPPASPFNLTSLAMMLFGALIVLALIAVLVLVLKR